MKKVLLTLLSILLSFTTTSTFAWNATGHMEVAAIAWHSFSDDEKTSITNILKQHPEFEQTWKKKYKEYKNDLELGLFLMMQASKWPDDIRSRKHPLNKYHRGNWHYITYELHFNEETAHKTEGADSPNIVWAIAQAKEKIADYNTENDVKAMHLSWLIHLIGDIHQPLHAASLFNDTDLANGDRGGNLLYIKPDSESIKLHSYWDQLLGKSKSAKDANMEALRMRGKHNQKGNAKLLDAQKWSMESFELAKSKVHMNGKLAPATSREEPTTVSSSYDKKSKKLAEKRATLAGYRLANQLKVIL